MPRVSVLMPVRNGEQFLAEAIDSILAQSLADIELIVVDDGSTDGSAQIVAEACVRDVRIRSLTQGPLGLCAALNMAADTAAAPLLARLDADDVALPHRLERQVAFLDRNPGVAVVGGGVIVIDESGSELERGAGPERVDLSKGNPLSHPTVTMRADALRKVGGYRLYPAEDFDLWLRIEEHYQLAALRDLLVKQRFHVGQVSLHTFEQQALTALAVRAAARIRRAGLADPLTGVGEVDAPLLTTLGVDAGEAREAVVGAAVEWAAMLVRANRADDAAALLREVGTRPGWPTVRSLRVSVGLRLAKRAMYRRRPLEVAQRLLRTAWAGASGQ